MSKWAALVHGRTYAVDFRDNLIVVPSDFTDREIAWAKRYILGTTISPEGLRHRTRWSLFNDGTHCVVGVTCMAHEVSDDMHKDEFGRPLYVFLGYVSQPPFAPIPPMCLELFKPLYQYVRDRWEERSHNANRRFTCDYSLDIEGLETTGASTWEFNQRVERIYLDPVRSDEKIWTAAAAYNGPLSVCLGLAYKKNACAGPFLNVTAEEVERPIDLGIAQPPPPQPLRPAPEEKRWRSRFASWIRICSARRHRQDSAFQGEKASHLSMPSRGNTSVYERTRTQGDPPAGFKLSNPAQPEPELAPQAKAVPAEQQQEQPPPCGAMPEQTQAPATNYTSSERQGIGAHADVEVRKGVPQER